MLTELTHTYRHKKTGATFTSTSVCNGEDWEEIARDGAADSVTTYGAAYSDATSARAPKGRKNG